MRQLTRFLLLATLATGCGDFGLVGSGNRVAQTRAIGAFKKLELAGGVQVTFTRGPPALVVTADDNLLDQVETVVRDDTLLVRLRSPVADPSGIKAAISNDALEALGLSGGSSFAGPAIATSGFDLAVSGGSTVELSDLTSTHLIANASGGSRITLTRGATTTFSIAASGGSQVTSHGFAAEQGTVDASGASNVCVTCTRSLTGNASGGSTITVSGSPSTVVVNSSGGSRVIDQN